MSSAERLVAVGSANPTKVDATRRVFARLWPDARVEAVAVPSGVRPQPIGWAETRRGALQRARRARAAAAAAVGVGLEGGVVFDRAGRGWLVGVAAVVGPGVFVGTAAGPTVPLPPPIAEAVRRGEELAPVMEAWTGEAARVGPGAIGWLTGGFVTREASWVVTLAAAAAPLFHPDRWDRPVS
ncbi:MAG: DUF84 family protein [Actinomycetia bacterium]|nr:DUF84 family protein [Actinomycetes bacterium]